MGRQTLLKDLGKWSRFPGYKDLVQRESKLSYWVDKLSRKSCPEFFDSVLEEKWYNLIILLVRGPHIYSCSPCLIRERITLCSCPGLPGCLKSFLFIFNSGFLWVYLHCQQHLLSSSYLDHQFASVPWCYLNEVPLK